MQEKESDFFETKLVAKKSLGQHFLRSEKALNQIVEAIAPPAKGEQGGVVFEIGPGEGVLTKKLLEKGFTVLAIEIDKRSIEILEQKFKKEIKNKKLFIIEKDCLEVDYGEELAKIPPTPFKKGVLSTPSNYVLLGNIPYYITGAIFRSAFEQKVLPQQIIFLIQKEVAQRIIANDKKESILSVSIKIFTPPSPPLLRVGTVPKVRIIDIVKAGSFVPPPKVDSAILAINNIESPFVGGGSAAHTQEIFFKILKAAFSQKRKFLLSNLKNKLEESLQKKYFTKIEEIILENYSEKARAEDLSLETWKKIVEIL